ncbi:hypothetical protein BZA05DRAFT_394848 [Tricharina praecox]|uniref:uncharacterized protein n=1 Tax=Tricharina praecox TaxID=43433 RepID=UPI0022204A74|nr:uncharacterized protein BZA05DRAFT_394848 [Tricharina praecox]KAI5853826.1 hypothetical protein BZA05DRAFT_394848 [Tricharina praecox]
MRCAHFPCFYSSLGGLLCFMCASMRCLSYVVRACCVVLCYYVCVIFVAAFYTIIPFDTFFTAPCSVAVAADWGVLTSIITSVVFRVFCVFLMLFPGGVLCVFSSCCLFVWSFAFFLCCFSPGRIRMAYLVGGWAWWGMTLVGMDGRW